MNFKRNKLAIVVASMLAFSGGVAAEDKMLSISIDSKSVEEALSELSSTTDLDIVLSKGVDVDAKLSGLRGDYTLQGALTEILKGSGLTYELTPAGLIVISNAADEGSSDDSSEEVDEEADEEVVVTGTRLKNTAPTSPVVTITREDMDKQGLVTAADVVRSLPQNFSSINIGSTTSLAAQGDITGFQQGKSAADLRGVGSDGTLVLVNGRRMAGSAVFDGGQINLETIPSAAIERVEVLLDGASAIYGADAIAGVINFILKDDYAGATTKVRYENSINGANGYSLSQTLGYTWDSGNVLLSLEYSDTDSVNAAKAGYTTQDLTSQGGTDHRNNSATRPHNPANIVGFGALPDTFDGTESWTAADLIPTDQLPPADLAIAQTASSSKTTSTTLSVRQDITDSVSAFVDTMYSKDETETQNDTLITPWFLSVPTTNPYNRLGVPVGVALLATGLDMRNTSDSERLNVAAGFDIELPFKDWALNVTGNYGVEESTFTRSGLEFADILTLLATENVFGNNASQVVASYIKELPGGYITQPPERDNRSIELSANGSLFSIAGGDVSLALGTQFREETRSLDPELFGYADTEQTLENAAYFFELSVPLVGAENAMPGVQGLLLSVAGRDESYEMNGQFDGPALPSSTKTFGEFVPKVGLRWDINDEFLIRSSWGESFKAPNLQDLFNGVDYFPQFGPFVSYVDGNGDTQMVLFARGGNPDLESETSTTFTFGFEWVPEFVDGLTMSATYTDIEWENRIDVIAVNDARLGTANPEDFGLIQFDVAAENGGDGDPTTPDAWPARPINLASRTSTSIDAYVAYQFDTDIGAFEVDLTAVKTLEVVEQLFSFTAAEERQGTEVGPDDWVVRAHLGWNRDNHGANLYAKYSSSYERDADTVFQDKVEHYITYDLTGFYEMDNGFKITAGALNLTNQKFPFYNNRAVNYDPRRVDARGRVVYMEVSKEFNF